MMFCWNALTPQELADVKTYLKTKWLGAHVPNDGDGTEPVTELDVPAGTVDVAHGSTRRAVKRGEGTLELNSLKEVATDLSVEAGTLAFVSKGTAPKVQVWADFGDGSSLKTSASGQVLSIRNKGVLGGAFTQTSVTASNYGSPAPARVSGGALALADGVTVKIDGGTIRVDSLTVPAGAEITLDPGKLNKDTDKGRALIEFASGTVAGSFVLPRELRTHWSVEVRDGAVSLVYWPGTAIIVR